MVGLIIYFAISGLLTVLVYSRHSYSDSDILISILFMPIITVYSLIELLFEMIWKNKNK